MADRPKIEFELTAVDNISSKLSSLKKSFRSASKSTGGFRNALKSATQSVKTHTGALGNLLSSIKRIAFYRVIRSALKAVTQAFKEGTNNLVLYSRALNDLDSSHAYSTMNELATTALYVKNSLGAALMPVLQSLVPLINTIADAFVTAANAVNQFFHALKGEDVFTKAKRYAVDYADSLDNASGSAKELKKQIFGFDELNIFNKPSSGGGGGGSGLDYSEMFEESPISDFLKQIKKNIEEGDWDAVGNLLANKLNKIVDKIDGDKLGTDIGTKIQYAIDFAYGFVHRLKFNEAGTKLAEVFNGITKKVKLEKLGKTVSEVITGAIEFGASFLEDADLGDAINNVGKAFVGLFSGLSSWIQDIEWDSVGQKFYEKLRETLTKIDFDEIASSIWEFFGSSFGAAFELAKGILFDGLWEDVKTYFKTKSDECGGDTVEGFCKGINDALTGIDEWIYNNITFPFIDGLLRGLGIETGYSKETYTVGGETVTGFFQGGVDKIEEYKNWVKEKFVDPFINKLKLNFGLTGGNPVSAVVKTIGEAVTNSFFLGLKEKWENTIVPWLAEKARSVKDTLRGINDELRGKHESARQLDYGYSPSYYAEGGTPSVGSLFWAGEAGAELITQVGGQTTVTTQDQFSAGMSEIMDNTNSVIMQAASSLIQAIMSKPVPSIRIGDRDIVSMYDRGKSLAGGALVE